MRTGVIFTGCIVILVSLFILVSLNYVISISSHHGHDLPNPDLVGPPSLPSLSLLKACLLDPPGSDLNTHIEDCWDRHVQEQQEDFLLPRTKQREFNGELERKFNVLFLYDYGHVQTIMDRSFFQILEAAKRNKNIAIAEMYGRDWPEWDTHFGENENEQIADNIAKKFPGIKWDIIITEPDRGHPLPDLDLKVAPINCVYYHELYCSEGFGKCPPPRLLKESNLLLFAYANSMPTVYDQVTEGDKYTSKLFYHIPHGAPKDLFYENVDSPRDIPVLLVGKVNKLYPLRVLFKKLISEYKIDGEVREHPGYHNIGTADNDMGWNETTSAMDQEVNYAAQLKRAKILLVTNSIRHYALRKYVEGALAGCLLVGNIPDERQEEFRKYMVEVDLNDPEEYILQQIEWWLANEEQRKKFARRGQLIALRNYTYDQWIQKMLFAANLYLEGSRGMYFPHQFSITGAQSLN